MKSVLKFVLIFKDRDPSFQYDEMIGLLIRNRGRYPISVWCPKCSYMRYLTGDDLRECCWEMVEEQR